LIIPYIYPYQNGCQFCTEAAAKVGGIQLIAGLVADSAHPGGVESNGVLATRKQN
jgi:hypothetical protein